MSSDMFLKIDGIEGDSTDANHKKWIEIEEAQYSIENLQAGQARKLNDKSVRDPADFKSFTIVKHLDVASPLLSLACSDGRRLKSATIEFCRPIGDKVPYAKYVLNGCGISKVQLMPPASDDQLPKETIEIVFDEVHWYYMTTMPGGGGKTGYEVSKGWNRTQHKEVVP